jgi:hypothetical protein
VVDGVLAQWADVCQCGGERGEVRGGEGEGRVFEREDGLVRRRGDVPQEVDSEAALVCGGVCLVSLASSSFLSIVAISPHPLDKAGKLKWVEMLPPTLPQQPLKLKLLNQFFRL